MTSRRRTFARMAHAGSRRRWSTRTAAASPSAGASSTAELSGSPHSTRARSIYPSFAGSQRRRLRRASGWRRCGRCSMSNASCTHSGRRRPRTCRETTRPSRSRTRSGGSRLGYRPLIFARARAAGSALWSELRVPCRLSALLRQAAPPPHPTSLDRRFSASGCVPEPLETVEDEIEPELERALTLVAWLHVLLDVLGQVWVLVGGEVAEEPSGHLVEVRRVEPEVQQVEREAQDVARKSVE